MSSQVEPSRRPRSTHRRMRNPAPPDAPRAGLSASTQEYGLCARPGCGGLIVRRSAVTDTGECEELVCVACSRSRLVSFREVYPPLRPDRDPKMEACCTPSPARVRRSGGVEEVEVPREVAEAIRD